MPLPFGECSRLRSRLCCNQRVASALILPPNDRGGRTSLDKKRDGVPVVHSKRVRLQTFRPFTSLALNSHSTHSDATLLWNDWGNRDGMLVPVATRRKIDRELCVALWYKKTSKYHGNGCEICSLWYVYVPMMSVGGSSNRVFHKTNMATNGLYTDEEYQANDGVIQVALLVARRNRFLA